MTTGIALLGIDLGKHSFHVHGQDAIGHMRLRRECSRSQLLQLLAQLPACTVAMEACAGSHWIAWRAREYSHTVRLIDPRRVRAFLAGNKHDFADAQAICEAARRPSIRSITPKTAEQLALTSLHRLRDARVGERTACMNQVHAFLLEFGIAVPTGRRSIQRVPTLLAEDAGQRLPQLLRRSLELLYEHFCYLQQQLKELDREISATLKADETAERLLSIPGIGPITASCLCAQIGDVRQYATSRDFVASIGLAPRQHSTGGRPKLLGISKRGDSNLRRLLVQCARSLLQRVDRREDALHAWARRLRLRRHTNIVACAVAAKLARIVWALLTRGCSYVPHPGTPGVIAVA